MHWSTHDTIRALMPSELKTERRASTLVLTLSDPATRNALSPQVYAAGVEALATAEADPDLRVVILTGDGGHFSAGGNLSASNRHGAPTRSHKAIR